MSRTLTVHEALSSEDLAATCEYVAAGGVLVLPTDTVYGIGATAHDAAAVARVLALKGRGRQMPPPVLVAGVEAIDDLCVDVPDAARTLASAHWPGGLTLILTARPDLGWDLGETGGTLALRMPDHPAALAILGATGPLAVTSANLTGEPPARRIEEARAAFGEGVGLYVDAGPTPGTTPSTIVDLAHGHPRALRLGTLSLEDLSRTIGAPVLPPA